MIDMHCHVLHEMDDGAQNIEEALDMCKVAVENGIEKIIVTPHFSRFERIDEFIEKRDAKLCELKEKVKDELLILELYKGAEIFVNEDILLAGATLLSKLALNSSKYVLIEFSFRHITPENMLKYIDHIVAQGFVPIIAHPERYDCIQEDYALGGLVTGRGAHLQVNADSLAGKAGRSDLRLASELVLKNAVSFIATDAHSTKRRNNKLMNMINYFPKGISYEQLDFMLNTAGEIVLSNGDLPEVRHGTIIQKHRRW